MEAQIFSLGNMLALAGWVLLLIALFAPPARKILFALTGLVIPLILAVAYVGLLVTAHDVKGGFGSIAQVRELFANDGALTSGWLHYLAFDMFVGTWIARDGLERGIMRLLLVPCLVLTFMIGPSGFLLYGIVRLAFSRRGQAVAA
jgi:hypothetical protein